MNEDQECKRDGIVTELNALECAIEQAELAITNLASALHPILHGEPEPTEADMIENPGSKSELAIILSAYMSRVRDIQVSVTDVRCRLDLSEIHVGILLD